MIVDFNVWDGELSEKIDNLKRNHIGIKKIIINGLYEFAYNSICGSEQKLLDLIKFTVANDIELHILTSCHSNSKLLPEIKNTYIHNWATFWLTLTFTRLMYHSNYEFNKNLGLDFFDMNVSKNIDIKIPYISMTKLPKVHRSIMMDMLAKNNVLRKDCIIWREWGIHYKFNYWNQEILLMDQVEKFECQEIFPTSYANAFMQIVPESTDTAWFLTEKTAMPLFFNKPFLVAGSLHFHKLLSDMGFKLYDELFDYSFDDEPDCHKRYDLLARNLIGYLDKTPAELKIIYDSVFDKCVYNKKLAMKLATDSTLRPPYIWEELIDHQVKNNIPEFPYDINNFILKNENVYRF